jgi:hypothetical protein
MVGKGVPLLPRMLVYPLNIALWLRWVLYIAWRDAASDVSTRGDEITSLYGISARQQYLSCLWLALAHTIPCRAYYQYRLYLSSKKSHWDYVYPSELAGYYLADADTPIAREERYLLSRKHEFANLMRSRGVCVAEGEFLSKGCCYNHLQLDRAKQYFLKPESGSRSIGAYQLKLDSNGDPILHHFSGSAKSGGEAVDLIDRQLQEQNCLLQPCYFNHPGFDELDCGTDEVIVLRIITRRIDHVVEPYCSYLEIPVATAGVKKGYLFVQVNTEDGAVIAQSLDLSVRHWSSLVSEFKMRLEGFMVPQWDECLANNILAHRQINALKTVAWDNVITAEGALILEGNSNWAVELPQIFCGGLVDTGA